MVTMQDLSAKQSQEDTQIATDNRWVSFHIQCITKPTTI